MGLVGGFNNNFLGNSALFNIKDVPSFFEFSHINPDFHGLRNPYLICYKPGLEFMFNEGKMYKNSAHFKQLKKFLLENDFDHTVWWPLFLEKFRNRVMNLSIDSIGLEKFATIPLHQVVKINKSGKPYFFLLSLIEEVSGENIFNPLKTGDILKIDEVVILSALEKEKDKKVAMKTLASLQSQFRDFGLNESHTKFMGLSFS